MHLRKNLRLGLLLCLASSPAFAQTSTPPTIPPPPYSAIYVFGDSYNDVGNFYIATGNSSPQSPPYFHGRFSNGPLWVEHLAGSMNLPMLPALAGGNDYAVGGAQVIKAVPAQYGIIPSIPQQVQVYLTQHAGKADPKALYILEGGGNDILDSTNNATAQALGAQIAHGLADSERVLRRAGARHFLIPNLFNVGLLPAAAGNPAFATAASLATNKVLDELLENEFGFEDTHILRVDVFALINSVQTDTTHFGFTDVTNPCINAQTGVLCADPDHTLFWDLQHPSTFGHSLFAVAAESALNQAKHHHDDDHHDDYH